MFQIVTSGTSHKKYTVIILNDQEQKLNVTVPDSNSSGRVLNFN